MVGGQAFRGNEYLVYRWIFTGIWAWSAPSYINWSVAKVFCHIQSTQLHPIMRQYRRNLLLSRIWQFINEGYETQMILVRISFPRYLIFIFFVAQVNLTNYLGKRIKPYQHWEPIYIGTNEVTGPNIKFSL